MIANHRYNLQIKIMIVLNMNTLCQKINEEFALQAMNGFKVYLTLTMSFKVMSVILF